MKTQRALFVSATAVLLFSASCGLWLWTAKQQYARNRQLIAALVYNDLAQAKSLVQAGADPNTHFEASPPPSLPQMAAQLLRLPETVI